MTDSMMTRYYQKKIRSVESECEAVSAKRVMCRVSLCELCKISLKRTLSLIRQ